MARVLISRSVGEKRRVKDRETCNLFFLNRHYIYYSLELCTPQDDKTRGVYQGTDEENGRPQISAFGMVMVGRKDGSARLQLKCDAPHSPSEQQPSDA